MTVVAAPRHTNGQTSKSVSSKQKAPIAFPLFEASDRLVDDPCAQQTRIQENAAQATYQLDNLRSAPDPCKTTRKVESFAQRYPNLRPWTGYGVSGCQIDTDSHIRNEKIWTNDPSKTQYFPRTFQAVPKLWRGVPMPETESRLINGLDTTTSRQSGDLSEKQFPVFHPTVLPVCTKHIIPEWTWGGESSRDISRSPEFLRSLGYEYDYGRKIWLRKRK